MTKQQLKSALINAVHAGDPEALHNALEQGANPNSVLGEGMTALMWCVEREQERMLECMDLLLAHGANPNQCGNRGETALMKACWQGRSDAVLRLVQAGAEVNHQGQDGFSMLMSTAGSRRGTLECMHALLAAGADTELRSNTGSTAWLVFARKGHREALECLLRAGADPTCQDDVGNHAWEVVGTNFQDTDLPGWLKSQAEAHLMQGATPNSHTPKASPRL